MPELVFFCKLYHHLIFKVEGIVRNDLVWDTISVNKVGPDEIRTCFAPTSLNEIALAHFKK